tara:strand:- start:8790 stop:9587 length:798 start_codon:yes stop_codon:yes gene_type:complete
MILSIDPGIRNLAVCLLNCLGNNKWQVLRWDSIDLLNANCGDVSCSEQKCAAAGKVEHNRELYCLRHAKKTGKEFAPLDYHKLKKNGSLSKKRAKELQREYGIELGIPILDYIHSNCLVPIQKHSIKDITESTIAEKLCTMLESIEGLDQVRTVLIENQIGPCAVRMRSLQSMITMYFTCRYQGVKIVYVSGKNKLSLFGLGKTTYSERKAAGVEIVAKIISEYEELRAKFANTVKKKDDLADAFLQAYWYISTKLVGEFAFSLA